MSALGRWPFGDIVGHGARQSAAVVVTVIFLAFGVFLLLRGIGRGRRSRLPSGPATG